MDTVIFDSRGRAVATYRDTPRSEAESSFAREISSGAREDPGSGWFSDVFAK